MDTIVSKLKEKNLKLTPQRLAIFKMLYNTDTHPTAETIYKSLSDTHPSMSLATVYKTLDSLKKSNLIQELNLGEDSFRYDARCEFHIHLKCEKCGKIFDMVPPESISLLNLDVADKSGFEIDSQQIYYFGTCKDCVNDKNN